MRPLSPVPIRWLPLLGLILTILTTLGTQSRESSAKEFGVQAREEFSIKRKAVFEFMRKPSITRKGDRVDIRFAVKDYCDLSVAIEDAQGTIRRHLASGVLGAKAPAPFKKNALEQHLIWDGKDDFGHYLDNTDELTVRVSLGLKAQFEKNLYWNPHRCMGNDTAIAIDKDGVYLYRNNLCDWVTKFDHDGNYRQTLYPFARGKLDKIKGLPWRKTIPDGEDVPNKAGFGHSYPVTLLPFPTRMFKVGRYMMGDMVARDGMLTMVGTRMTRLGTDGTTQGHELAGKSGLIPGVKHVPTNVALDPSGKWLYLGRIFRGTSKIYPYQGSHGIYRMSVDDDQEPKLFLGSDKSGRTDDTFTNPMSVATDSKGRIYVTDWDNDRVRIFSPAGKLVCEFPLVGPAEVEVNPQTGVFYVVTWKAHQGWVPKPTKGIGRGKVVSPRVRKYAALDEWKGGNPKLLMEAGLHFPIPNNRKKATYINPKGYGPRFVFDFWSKPTRIWVSIRNNNYDGLFLLEERDGKLIMKRAFDAEVAQAGFQNGMPFFQRQFMYYDPQGQTLYVAEMDCNGMKNFRRLVAIDVRTGNQKIISLPGEVADAGIDAQGMIYLRIKNTVSRYHLPSMREVPYDYGEERGKTISLIPTPGGGGSSHKYGSFGVSPKGEVIVACVYGMGKTDRREGAKTAVEGGTKWKPALYPGRPGGGHFVHVFDAHGMLKHEDTLKGGGLFTGGLDMDFQGHIYSVIRKSRILDGKLFRRSGIGSLMRFKPEKCRFLTDLKATVELKEKPARPQDVGGLWAEGAEWIYGNASSGSTSHCWCRHGKFKVDYFGRSFVPEPTRYSIAVLDPAGQLITRIGRYGNVDDGKPLEAGPKGAVHRSIGGDEVALFDAHFVTVHSDQRLFIADFGNARILSVKLDYHATERVGLKEVSDDHRK